MDIPDTSDRNFERFQYRSGEIVAALDDDAGEVTGEDRDSIFYRVEFPDGESADFRWRDLRPSFDSGQGVA